MYHVVQRCFHDVLRGQPSQSKVFEGAVHSRCIDCCLSVTALILWQIFGQRWSTVAEHMPGRLAKQCRERYLNNLDPDLRRGAWSRQVRFKRVHKTLVLVSYQIWGYPFLYYCMKDSWKSTIIRGNIYIQEGRYLGSGGERGFGTWFLWVRESENVLVWRQRPPYVVDVTNGMCSGRDTIIVIIHCIYDHLTLVSAMTTSNILVEAPHIQRRTMYIRSTTRENYLLEGYRSRRCLYRKKKYRQCHTTQTESWHGVVPTITAAALHLYC